MSDDSKKKYILIIIVLLVNLFFIVITAVSVMKSINHVFETGGVSSSEEGSGDAFIEEGTEVGEEIGTFEENEENEKAFSLEKIKFYLTSSQTTYILSFILIIVAVNIIILSIVILLKLRKYQGNQLVM